MEWCGERPLGITYAIEQSSIANELALAFHGPTDVTPARVSNKSVIVLPPFVFTGDSRPVRWLVSELISPASVGLL